MVDWILETPLSITQTLTSKQTTAFQNDYKVEPSTLKEHNGYEGRIYLVYLINCQLSICVCAPFVKKKVNKSIYYNITGTNFLCWSMLCRCHFWLPSLFR